MLAFLPPLQPVDFALILAVTLGSIVMLMAGLPSAANRRVEEDKEAPEPADQLMEHYKRKWGPSADEG